MYQNLTYAYSLTGASNSTKNLIINKHKWVHKNICTKMLTTALIHSRVWRTDGKKAKKDEEKTKN